MKESDKFFKDKLYDHESAVPNHVWEQVAADLDQEENKKPVYWHWAAVILLLIGTSFFMLREPSAVQIADDSRVQEEETNTPALVIEEQQKTEVIIPIIEVTEKRTMLTPMLTALDSRALVVSKVEEEVIMPVEIAWEEMTPEYKEEGRILVRVQLASHTADEVPKENQKKSWRDRIKDARNADKKIKIPKPNINLAEIFAAK